MVSIFVCDDDEKICERNKVTVQKICSKHGIWATVKTFYSGQHLLERLERHPQDVDIILLDILMTGENGIEVAKKLRGNGCVAEIIFLTSSEAFIFEAFETEALHYLIKDSLDMGKFEATLLKAEGLAKKKKKEGFIFEAEGEKYHVAYSSILYFKSALRAVEIHYDYYIKEFLYLMKDLEKEVGGRGIIRVHRSYLVNMRQIDQIRGRKILLSNGEEIPVGAKFAESVRCAFQTFLLRGI